MTISIFFYRDYFHYLVTNSRKNLSRDGCTATFLQCINLVSNPNFVILFSFRMKSDSKMLCLPSPAAHDRKLWTQKYDILHFALGTSTFLLVGMVRCCCIGIEISYVFFKRFSLVRLFFIKIKIKLTTVNSHSGICPIMFYFSSQCFSNLVGDFAETLKNIIFQKLWWNQHHGSMPFTEFEVFLLAIILITSQTFLVRPFCLVSFKGHIPMVSSVFYYKPKSFCFVRKWFCGKDFF